MKCFVASLLLALIGLETRAALAHVDPPVTVATPAFKIIIEDDQFV